MSGLDPGLCTPFSWEELFGVTVLVQKRMRTLQEELNGAGEMAPRIRALPALQSMLV